MSFPVTEVSSIILHDGKVLIGRPTEGKWDVPTVVVRAFEGVKEAAQRATFENVGLATDPQNVMFVSESIKKGSPPEHRIIIYVFSKYVSGELKPEFDWQEAVWADLRELADYQDEMSDAAVDAFYKFSLVLRQSAGRAG